MSKDKEIHRVQANNVIVYIGNCGIDNNKKL